MELTCRMSCAQRPVLISRKAVSILQNTGIIGRTRRTLNPALGLQEDTSFRARTLTWSRLLRESQHYERRKQREIRSCTAKIKSL